MWQLIAFFAGYALLIVLLLMGMNVVVALTSLICIYLCASTFMTGFEPVVSSLKAMLEWTDLSTFTYVFLGLLLAGVLREAGYLELMVGGASSIRCKGSYFIVPAMIGLLPVPGAALISSIATRGRFSESHIRGELAAFINYWFTHLWILSWPLYQGIIVGAAIFKTSPEVLVSITWPTCIALAIAGALITYPAIKQVNCHSGGGQVITFLKSIWPLALLTFLIFAVRTSLLNALLITIALSILTMKVEAIRLRNALRLAITPKIHLIIFETLLLKNILILTKAPQAFFTTLSSTGLPSELIVTIVPAVISFATNNEVSALPLLINYIAPDGLINKSSLLLAYISGCVGVLISPIHPCLTLTIEYFKVNLLKVLKLVIPALITTIALVIPLIVFI